MKIFIDTSAFIAQLIKSEKFHQTIINKLQEYDDSRAIFFTSDYILDELYTRINYDFGGIALKKVITNINKSIEVSDLRILKVDTTIFNQAAAIMLKYSKLKLSFTDATSIILIKTFKLSEMLSLDEDFTKAGVLVGRL